MTVAPGPAPIPGFVPALLGYRVNPKTGQVTTTPNSADGDNQPSIRIAKAILESFGIAEGTGVSGDLGTQLELGVEEWLRNELPALAPNRNWSFGHKRAVTEFVQYEHLARIQKIIDTDPTQTLKAEIGTDYVIKPDVTIGLSIALGNLLHASISCKWTIRSDRVQNIRHEAVILTRHRRGRQPHIVVVTAEPLPSRLASIARGTGEVDAVYHVALAPLTAAVQAHASAGQRSTLDELVDQDRLKDLTDLPAVLAD